MVLTGLPAVTYGKLALVWLVVPVGPPVMFTVGAVVSTTQVWEAGDGSGLPAVSVARTWKLWLVSLSDE